MKNKHYLIIILVFILINLQNIFAVNITDYKKFIALCIDIEFNKELVIIRSFKNNDRLSYLCVDSDTLETKILEQKQCKIVIKDINNVIKNLNNSNYIKLINLAKKNNNKLQNSGIITTYSEKGYILTNDLCPTKKKLDYATYFFITDLYKNYPAPIPIAISVSGRWIVTHEKDLEWLRSLENEKKIQITWINHSYNHKYNKDLALEKNFLLMHGTNLTNEVLETEKLILCKNLIPSIFFRFPGLVSNKNIFNKIIEFGLIPIGSDAWLAKGQTPKPGSIILVHTNNNDPEGIKKLKEFFLKQVKSKNQHLSRILDIKEGLIDLVSQ